MKPLERRTEVLPPLLEGIRKGKVCPVLKDEQFTKQSKRKPSGRQQGKDCVIHDMSLLGWGSWENTKLRSTTRRSLFQESRAPLQARDIMVGTPLTNLFLKNMFTL